MASQKTKKEKPEIDQESESLDEKFKLEVDKSDEEGFKGGLKLNLARIMKSGQTLETELSKHIKDELDTELKNHEKLEKKISRSLRQYKGRKKPKAYPFPGCANVAVPLTRYIVDTILVRLIDAIFNRRKVIIVKARKPELNETARKIEEALDWYLKHILKFREKMHPAISESLKLGTGIAYVDWVSKKRTVYRYANEFEKEDKNVKKYDLPGTNEKAVKDVQTVYEGPQIYTPSRADVLVSSDAENFSDAYLCGFRKTVRRFELDVKAKQDYFRKEAVSKIFEDSYSEPRETRAELQEKELDKTDFSQPIEYWKLWFKYDVDEDGDVDDIIVYFHAESGAILRAIYNPVFTGNRPFVKFVGNPVEHSFDGEGMCESLYQLQEEVDTIHNQRLDRMTLINSYVTMGRSGIGLEDFRWTPGKHYVVDDVINDENFRVIMAPDIYPSTFNEEQMLTSLAEKVGGATPAVMGIQTAERPVYKETLANTEESNKKFKSYVDNEREGITELIYQILELFAQYKPTMGYKTEVDGQMVEQSVDIPFMSIRDGLEIDLAASTEMKSQEVRREINLTVFQMLQQYMTNVAGIGQSLVNPQIPPSFKNVLMEANRIGVELLKEILTDFDKNNAESLVLDLSKVLKPQDLMPPPLPPMPPQGPHGPPGMGPSGPPPGGPPEGQPPGPPPGPPQGPPPNLRPGMM